MNFVFLSPHFPPNLGLFCAHLNRFGIQVLAIADQAWEQLRPELRASLTDYVQVRDLHDTDALRRALRHFERRHGAIDRIESMNEWWLKTQAQLRTEFGIPGIKNDGIDWIKRKSRMKQVFEAHGIPAIPGRLIPSFEEALDAAAQLGYPVVVKPDIGVGASNTYKLRDDSELAYFFATKPPELYIMEQYIEGMIVTFDGLADREGHPVFCTSHAYPGVMETVLADDHCYFYSLRQIPEDLERLGRRTLAAFEARETFFHFEYFRRPDGSLIALEINMRPPGGPILDMCNYSADVDLYRAYAEIVATGHSSLDYQRKYHTGYIGRKHRFSYVLPHERLLARLDKMLIEARPMERAFAGALGDDAYIIRTESFERMASAIEDALRRR